MPGRTSFAGSTRYWTSISSDVSPKFQPARNAARLASSGPACWRTCVAASPRSAPSGGRTATTPRRARTGSWHATVARGDALDRLDRACRERRHRDPDQPVAAERAVLERVGLVPGLLQVALGERVLVDDHRAAVGSADSSLRSAAGFIATSTSGSSPGVRMSCDAKWIWKADTPRACRLEHGSRPGSSGASRSRCRARRWLPCSAPVELACRHRSRPRSGRLPACASSPDFGWLP